MTTFLKVVAGLLLVFFLTGASVDFNSTDDSNNERRRGGGACILLLFDRDASIIEQHDAVEWITGPVIQEGELRASGRIKGAKEMFTGEGWVVFNINEHNKDVRVANILKPGRSFSIGNNSARDIYATEWSLAPKSFSIRAPFDVSTPENLDLVVWGTDIETSGMPLAARSIKRLTE